MAAGSCPALAQNPLTGKAAAETTTVPDHLGDIVITARRRPELLQRTPVSVVAFTAADLEARSATNLRALQNFVPNLTFAPSQNVGEAAANVFIRGIGQEDFGVGAEGGVAFHLDGVYLPRSLGLLMDLVDTDRIEVLRGPQGTLYGKDAIGGVINLISKMPQPDRDRRANAILGSYGRADLRFMVNEPLSDRLFLRLAVGIVNRRGYLRRLPPLAPLALVELANGRPINLHSEGDDHGQGGRLQLRWLINSTLTADLSLDASRKRERQGPIHIDLILPNSGDVGALNALIRKGELPGPEITNALAPADLLESYAGGNNFTNQEFWGGSVVVTKQLAANTLKFIAAYRALRSHVGTDDDGLYFDLAGSDFEVTQHQVSGELQFNGVSGRLNYTAGLFGFTERPKLLPSHSITDVFYTCGCGYPPDDIPILTADPRQLRVKNLASYVQGTYQLTKRLSATLGARYSHERKALEGSSYMVDANFRPTNVVLATGKATHSWNSLTYRADVQYRAMRDVMAYASIARGYKSGGFNVRGEAGLPNMGFAPFDPETALTYEVGLRSEWLHQKLQLNATLFDTEYRDIQLRQQTLVEGEFTTLIENAARARIRGAEVELSALVSKGLILKAAYGHLEPRYLDVGQVRDLTLDSRFERTPRDSFAVSMNYERPVGSGKIELHGDYSYRSKEQFQILPAINDQSGYGLIGARVAFRPTDDRWSIALFGTNLADKRYRTAGRGTLLEQAGFAYSSVGMPRQLGVQLTTAF